MPEGFLLGRDHLTDLRAVVRDYKSRDRGRRPLRRRAPVFQPSAAGIVYQSVYPLLLRAGTTADPKSDSKFEPVCIAIQVGAVSSEKMRNLTHEQVHEIVEVIETGEASDKGVIVHSAIDNINKSGLIGQIVRDTLGDGKQLKVLRTRFADGFVGFGSVCIGNSKEIWQSSLGTRFVAEIYNKIDDDDVDDTLYIAQITHNQPAEDAEVISPFRLLTENVVIRERGKSRVDMARGAKCYVEFNVQPWFDNDTRYSPDYWYDANDYPIRWRPVFDVIERIGVSFSNSTEEEIPAHAVIRISGTATDNQSTIFNGAKPNTYGSQFSHYINGSEDVIAGQAGTCFDPRALEGGVVALYDSDDGTPLFGEQWGPRSGTWKLKKSTGGFRVVGVVDSEEHLVLVTQDPFLRFRGITDASIAKGADGTVSIYTGNNGSYSDTSVNMTDVYNDFGDVDSTKKVECVWEGDIEGVKWKIVAAEC